MKSLQYAAPNKALKAGIRPWVRELATGSGRCCAFLAAGVFMIAVSTGSVQGQGQGIAIYKENTALPDGSAKVFEYTMIRRAGEVTQYFMPNGQKLSLTLFQPQSIIAYPDLTTRSITAPSQLGPIENGVRAYRDIVNRHPSAARFLKPYIQTSDEMIRRVNGGEVVFNGRWMSRSEYEAMLQREDDSAKEHSEKSREKKRVLEEQALRLDLETRRHKR